MNNAAGVPFTAGTGSPPAATGGTIVDGVYQATLAQGFGTGAPQNGRQLTIVILDGATRWLWSGKVLDAAGAQTVSMFQANATATVSGTKVALTTDCMSGATSPLPASLDFSATQSELVLSLTNGSYTSVTSYMRIGCP
jgi:hypothetical protein